MSLGYVARRTGLFLVTVWAAATLNFIAPRLARGTDPVRAKLGQLAATGGLRQEGVEEMVKAYRAKFGLDRPLHVQYVSYLADTLRGDLGYSLSKYPAPVNRLIMNALPWTIGLLTVATLIGFVAGSLAGGLLAWPGSSSGARSGQRRSPYYAARFLVLPLTAFSAVPYYVLGLVLVYFFGLRLRLFPISGGYPAGVLPALSLSFLLQVLHHAALPALSMVLSGLGFWALRMRGMMVGALGEGYIQLAEANGLRPRTIFLRYAMRNACLPQLTSLGLSLGQAVSGCVLLEVVFAYPGVGTLLFQAISLSDYTLIHGIVFVIVLAVALATLVLDLVYPLLDPRVSYEGSM